MEMSNNQQKMYTLWNYMVDIGIATEDEIGLVLSINGVSLQTMESILYARTGYRTLDQLIEELEEENA